MRWRIALIAPLVLACSLASPGASNQPTALPTTSPPPTAVPTPAPTGTLAPTPPANATPEPTRPVVDSARPPDGLLASDGDPATGWLGSWCWTNSCLDSGRLPRNGKLPSLEVAAGSQLTFTLADGTQFLGWSVTYGADANHDGTELATGGDPYDPDTSASPPVTTANATFPTPPQGDWAVGVFVRFPDGDASYYWHVSVP